ncbi:11053_t:CDS:2, partial [Gigaspora margarita]
ALMKEKKNKIDRKDKSREYYKKKIDCLDIMEGTQEILEKKEYKEVLLLTECRVSDYGTKEVQKQYTENKVAGLAKYNNLTESIIMNIKLFIVHNKMDIDQNKEASPAKNMIVLNNYKIRSKLNLTLWDIPIYTRAFYIKKALEFYRK